MNRSRVNAVLASFAALVALACGVAGAGEVVGRGDDLVVKVSCTPELPVRNLLPESCSFAKGLEGWRHKEGADIRVEHGAGPKGENALRISGNGAGAFVILPDGLVKPNVDYVVSCMIRCDPVVSSKYHANGGLGCGLTVWEPKYENGTSAQAYGSGPDCWRRVVSKPATMPAVIGPNEFWVRMNYTDGTGSVCDMKLFEAHATLTVRASAPSPIRQVKVVDESGRKVYDSGILADGRKRWEREIKVVTGHDYSVLAVAVDGDVASVDYPPPHEDRKKGRK